MEGRLSNSHFSIFPLICQVASIALPEFNALSLMNLWNLSFMIMFDYNLKDLKCFYEIKKPMKVCHEGQTVQAAQ